MFTDKMQVSQLVLFWTVIILTIGAGVFCLLLGGYGCFKLKATDNTEVKVGRHFSIKTPIPALVLCFFGLILFLTVGWLVNEKIELAKLTNTVSTQSAELAELRKNNEQLSASLEKATKASSDGLKTVESSVHSELATKASADDVKNVDTKVVGVRTDLGTTREDLKMPKSEMGTFIARNHDEIDQLRRMGERDYFEFTIEEGRAQKVGNVTVELKSINAKKDQFTIDVQLGDKSFEKKNRSVNEPIFFYTTGSRAPEELVINKLTKNQATGYLSVPKATPRTRRTAGPGVGCRNHARDGQSLGCRCARGARSQNDRIHEVARPSRRFAA